MSEELKDKSEEELAMIISQAKSAMAEKIADRRSETITQIKQLAAGIGMDVELTEKGGTVTPINKRGGKVPVKYRDGQGNAWTGRGMQPKWLQAALAGGRTLEDFKVAA